MAIKNTVSIVLIQVRRLLIVFLIAAYLVCLHKANNKDAGQTAEMYRLVSTFDTAKQFTHEGTGTNNTGLH